MVQPKRELLLTVVVIGFVWASLFGRWLPIPAQSVLFVIVLLLAWAMIVVGWWRWKKGTESENIARWRKSVGLLGLIANTLAVAIPFGVFSYQFALFRYALHWPMVDWLLVAPTCLAFSFCGFIAGVVAPPRIRFATVLGGLIVGSIILSIPIGIL